MCPIGRDASTGTECPAAAKTNVQSRNTTDQPLSTNQLKVWRRPHQRAASAMRGPVCPAGCLVKLQCTDMKPRGISTDQIGHVGVGALALTPALAPSPHQRHPPSFALGFRVLKPTGRLGFGDPQSNMKLHGLAACHVCMGRKPLGHPSRGFAAVNALARDVISMRMHVRL